MDFNGLKELVAAVCICFALQLRDKMPNPTNNSINFPSSPARLRTFPNGYEITNNSATKIVEYTLSCATDDRGKVNVLEVLPAKEASLGPGRQIVVATADSVEETILRCVKKRKIKIALFAIRFADGTSWQAPEVPK